MSQPFNQACKSYTGISAIRDCLASAPVDSRLTVCSESSLLRNAAYDLHLMEPTVKKPISSELLMLMAEKFRMLSDPTRLGILRCLMDGKEFNVSQMVRMTGRGLANVSKHLKQMANAGLLARTKVGSFVRYRLDDPVLEKICDLVCESLRRDLEAEMKQNKRLLRRSKSK